MEWDRTDQFIYSKLFIVLIEFDIFSRKTNDKQRTKCKGKLHNIFVFIETISRNILIFEEKIFIHKMFIFKTFTLFGNICR